MTLYERDAEGNLLPDDKRLTKVVRSTSIDELPQLIVLKGMSFIVPVCYQYLLYTIRICTVDMKFVLTTGYLQMGVRCFMTRSWMSGM